MTRNKIFSIRLTEQEHATAKVTAERYGYSSLSEWIRWLVGLVANGQILVEIKGKGEIDERN